MGIAKIVQCGTLTMLIQRSAGAIKSQRLVDCLVEAKRDNQDISISELEYIAMGFQLANKG